MTMTLVSTVTVGSGGAASIDFTSIPQTGTDLLIVISSAENSATARNQNIQFNGDTSGNYYYQWLSGNGSTSSVNSGSGDTKLYLGLITPISSYANTFSSTSIYVANYTSSASKSLSSDSTSEANATTAYQTIAAGRWAGTSAITSIKLGIGGGNFAQYSTASLYTIKNGSGGATVS